MRDATTTTIGQLLFTRQPELNFAHVVSELDAVLARYPADRRALSWDSDDMAVFDLDGSRIILGYADDRPGQYAACLTVAVGHGMSADVSAPLAQRRAALCRKIIDRLSARYTTDAVVWHDVEGPVTSDVIDRLLDTLPGVGAQAAKAESAVEIERLMARMSAELEVRLAHPQTRFAAAGRAVAAPFFAKARQRAQARATRAAAARRAPAPANRAPLFRNEELARVRAALYPDPPEEMAAPADAPPSTQMRLAIHAMNATMIVVFLPLGAAAMAYSILRGEDMRLSGRLMVLTGTGLALSQSPVGQHVMSMI